MNELGGVYVGKRSSINNKWVAWEVRGQELVHMGSQVPLMLASLNMEAKYELLSLKKPLKHGLYL